AGWGAGKGREDAQDPNEMRPIEGFAQTTGESGMMQSGSSGSGAEARLASLGITLPPAPAPVAAYIPFRRSGDLLYISGQIPLLDGKLIATGSVPGEVSPEVARECARQCVLNGLAVARGA